MPARKGKGQAPSRKHFSMRAEKRCMPSWPVRHPQAETPMEVPFPGNAKSLVSKITDPCGFAAPLCGRAPPFRAATRLFSHPRRAGGSASGAVRMRLDVRTALRAGAASPQSKRQSRRSSVDSKLLFWTRVMQNGPRYASWWFCFSIRKQG